MSLGLHPLRTDLRTHYGLDSGTKPLSRQKAEKKSLAVDPGDLAITTMREIIEDVSGGCVDRETQTSRGGHAIVLEARPRSEITLLPANTTLFSAEEKHATGTKVDVSAKSLGKNPEFQFRRLKCSARFQESALIPSPSWRRSWSGGADGGAGCVGGSISICRDALLTFGECIDAGPQAASKRQRG